MYEIRTVVVDIKKQKSARGHATRIFFFFRTDKLCGMPIYKLCTSQVVDPTERMELLELAGLREPAVATISRAAYALLGSVTPPLSLSPHLASPPFTLPLTLPLTPPNH